MIKSQDEAVKLLQANKIDAKTATANEAASYAKSVNNLLSKKKKKKEKPKNQTEKEAKAEAKAEAKKQEELQSGVAKCRKGDCGSHGVCANKRQRKKNKDKLCNCHMGYSGKLCDWSEAELNKAKEVVSETLSVISDINMDEEGSAEVVIDAVSALTENPDMISTEAANTALTVLDAGGDKELSPESAANAVSSVSSILAASDNAKGSDKEMSTEEKKSQSAAIMNVANKILDAIPATEGSFELDTPLIKAKKQPVDPDADVDAAAPDGSGLAMTNEMLKNIGEQDDMSVNVLSFKKNT